MSLPPLRGHHELRERLARSAAAGTLRQSVLLHGPAGVGKERLALWLAQRLLCERPGEVEPCGVCRACRAVTRLEHPDVHWFFPLPRPDGAADRLRERLEDQRAAELQRRREHPHQPPAYDRAPAHFLAAVQTLQQLAAVRPSVGSRKVFVVGDAELMVPQESSPEAANAFLKLLEEPPADTTLLLTSAQPGALLPTIRSRVLPIRVVPIPEREIADYLEVELGIEPAEAARVARGSRGAIGRALRQVPGSDGAAPLVELRAAGRDLLLAALSPGPVARLSAAHARSPSGGRGEFSDELDALSEWLRDLLAVASGAEAEADPETAPLLRRAVSEHDIRPISVTRALERVVRARELAQGNVNPQLIVADLLRGLQAELRRAAPRRPSGLR
ncbi:MAG TPA: hypothetical protein VFL93_17670 [Longimicrobiaceae bacterium]|nr:hypothetical protein [Longimicrobiaceae bacterium]